MTQKKPQISKLLMILSFTTIIFVLGLFLGNKISENKMTSIEDMEQTLRLETMSADLQYLIVAQEPCEFLDDTFLVEELYELGKKLDYMENSLGQDNEDVKQLKEFYFLLEIKHWMFMRKSKETCGTNDTLVLFFYDNDKTCPECKDQGYVLSNVRLHNPNLKVYSFDIGAGNKAVETLKTLVGVEKAPALVIGNKTITEFISKDDFLKEFSVLE